MVPVEPFEELGRHVAQQSQALLDPRPEHERLKASLLALAPVARLRRKRAPIAFGVATALAAAALVVFFFTRTPSNLTCFVGATSNPVRVGAWVSAPATDPLKLRFSDGTQASLWPRARGRITWLSPTGAGLVVEQGRASFSVVHRPQSHWQVSTGPFVVQVTGTRFDVDWQPENDHFELSLYEGHVSVSGCALGDGQELTAGQRIEVSCNRKEYGISAISQKAALASAAPNASESAATPALTNERTMEQAPQASTTVSQHGDSAHVSAMAVASLPHRAGVVTPSWADLGHAGRFSDAYELALKAGFDSECQTQGATEVLLLADVARLSGHLDRAREAYLVVRRRWPGSPAAALSAFQMGRAEFDQRRNFADAEAWLRTYLQEQPSGEFAAPAMGRLMEAAIHLNRYDSARELAKSYLNRYPKGSHAAAAHQVLDASPTSTH